MSWSEKYKKSINCDNPKGFSQRAHCQGRKKKMNENKSGDSSLHDWFSKSKSSDGKPGWVQLGGKYAGKPCAKQPGQTTKPKCGSSKMKRNLSKDEEEAAFRRKNREDPNPNRKGKAKNVATEEMNLDEKCWKGYTQKGLKKKGSRLVPNCVPVGESMTIDKDAHKVQQRREKMRNLMKRGVGGEREVAKRKLGKTAELPTLKREEVLDERSLSKGEEKDREKYVKGMKKSAKDFKARYGDDYKSVMYATATKMAKEEKEGDHEFEMARRQLKTANNASKRLNKKMGKKGEGELKAWVQAKLTRASDDLDTVADYVTNEEKNVHGDIEVPSGNGGKLKKLASRAAKRIDTDVDGDVEHNDKHKGEYGEFVPTGGDPRKAQGRQFTSMKVKSVKEAVGDLDEGIKMTLVKAIDKTKPGPLTRRGRIRDRLVRSEIKSAAEKNKKRRFSGLAASEKASKADKYLSPSSKTTASESFDIEESAAWTRKAGKNKEGGLNEKGRKSYERENPGSDLKAPSKKVGNPRRKSFCARMSGMKKKLTSSKTANDPNSRINKSLRAWNC